MTEAQTLDELLAGLVDLAGDDPWIADRREAWSAREFDARVSRLGAELLQRGVKPGDRVAAYLEHSLDLAAVPFACARIGALSVLVNPKLKDAQVHHVVDDCGARVVLSSEVKAVALRSETRAFEGHEFLHVEELSGEADCPRVSAQPGDAATILYTSGSTGHPKGIVQSHRSLCDGARIIGGYLGLDAEDHLLAVLPLSFDYGLNQVLSAAWSGAGVTLHGYFAAAELARDLAASSATGLAGVPELLVGLIDAFERGAVDLAELDALRYVTNSGGRLPQRVIDWFHGRMPQVELFSMYGLTEAFRSSFVPPAELAARPTSIGKAIPEVELLVIDQDSGRPSAVGEVGELVHVGALIAEGYWNRPEDEARCFRSHPTDPDRPAVFSGDLARVDKDGWLELVGRADGQIKVGGFRVSPDEVVEVVCTVEGAVTAAAVSLPRGPDGIPELCVAVVPSADADREALPRRVIAACRGKLPGYMVPCEVLLVDDLPLSPNHKPDHAAVRRLFR